MLEKTVRQGVNGVLFGQDSYTCYDSTNRFILVTLVISLRASLLPLHLELRPSYDQWREALFSICNTLFCHE